MIKNILFDIGRVFIRWDPVSMAEKFCPDRQTAERVAQATYTDERWANLDQGKLTVQELLEQLYREYPSQLHPYLKKAYDFPAYADIVWSTVELAKKLHGEGYRLYFASNFSERVYQVVERLQIGELFSGHFFSFEEKIVKPNPEFFVRLLKKYDLQADECVFLDDMEKNVSAAESVGIHGFVFGEDPDEAYAYIKSL